MGKKSPSPPAAPDPAAAAAAQGAANIDTAIAQGYMNRVNQVSPFGSSTFKQVGTQRVGDHDVPQFEQDIQLTPQQLELLRGGEQIGGELLDIGSGQLGRVRESFDVPLDFSGLPKSLSEAYGANPRQAVEDALYTRATSRLDPQFEQERDRFETQLSNQGFARGTEGYSKAVDDFTRGRNDAYARAREGAIIGGGAEESREASLRLGERQQAIQELLAKRSQPLNELATLLGTSPGVTAPQFMPPPQTGVNPTDVIGAIYGSAGLNQANYQTQVANQAASRGGIYGLAGTLGAGALMSPWLGGALGFPKSDPKSKTDKRPISDEAMLERVEDLPVESWRYKGHKERRVGPYADDWAEKFGGDGKVIPMPSIFGVTLAAVKALAGKVDKLERKAA